MVYSFSFQVLTYIFEAIFIVFTQIFSYRDGFGPIFNFVGRSVQTKDFEYTKMFKIWCWTTLSMIISAVNASITIKTSFKEIEGKKFRPRFHVSSLNSNSYWILHFKCFYLTFNSPSMKVEYWVLSNNKVMKLN